MKININSNFIYLIYDFNDFTINCFVENKTKYNFTTN